MKNVKQGFTLIELLVVVLIIGILASLALPQYMKAVEKSRSAEALSLIDSVSSAQAREFMRTGNFTTVVGNLDITIPTLKYFNMTWPAVGRVLFTRSGAGYSYNLQYTFPNQAAVGVYTCGGTNSAQCTAFLP